MTPHKRDQADQNVLLLLWRWLKKLWSTFGTPSGRWTDARITRTIVYFTLFLWLLLLLFGILTLHQAAVALLPLYALYPGAISSEVPGYNATLMYAWGTGAGVVFLALAIAATWRKKRIAAICFMALFLISTLIIYGRFVAALRTH